jgi:hypothetical protein
MCPASAGELKFTVPSSCRPGWHCPSPHPHQTKSSYFFAGTVFLIGQPPRTGPWHAKQHSDTSGPPKPTLLPKSSQPSSSGLWHLEPNQASAATTKWTDKPLTPALLARQRRAQGSSSVGGPPSERGVVEKGEGRGPGLGVS